MTSDAQQGLAAVFVPVISAHEAADGVAERLALDHPAQPADLFIGEGARYLDRVHGVLVVEFSIAIKSLVSRLPGELPREDRDHRPDGAHSR